MIVDASIWVSSELDWELDYRISLDWLRRQARRHVPLIVPALALTEVAAAVARATGNPARGWEAVGAMRAIATFQMVSLNDLLMERATDVAARFRIRGADAVYVALADLRGLPLVTWDRETHERAARLITVLRPG